MNYGSRNQILADSWSQGAVGYEELFVPRFAPWTEKCLAILKSHVKDLPAGGAFVPMCGPGQELLPVAEWRTLVRYLPARQAR